VAFHWRLSKPLYLHSKGNVIFIDASVICLHPLLVNF
jgi:hypothetical protein